MCAVPYRGRAVLYYGGSFISEADYEKLITEVVGKRAKKRALHLLEQMDRSEESSGKSSHRADIRIAVWMQQ